MNKKSSELLLNCCLQNKKPTPGPDQGTKTTSLSELCDRERESTSRSECFKETLSSREPLQKQDFVAQMQPVVSSCTRIPSASNTIEMGTGLPPPSFSGDVYTSTPLVPFYPPISVPPVLFSGTATPPSTANFSDTHSFKFNESHMLHHFQQRARLCRGFMRHH